MIFEDILICLVLGVFIFLLIAYLYGKPITWKLISLMILLVFFVLVVCGYKVKIKGPGIEGEVTSEFHTKLPQKNL